MSKLVIILLVMLLSTSASSTLLFMQLNNALDENRALSYRYNVLISNYSLIKQQLTNLTGAYDVASKGLENALTENSKLKAELDELRRNYELVAVENKQLSEWLRGNVSHYSREVEVLRTELDESINRYNKLFLDYEALSESLKGNLTYINELEAHLRGYINELDRLNSLLRRAVVPVDLPYEDHKLNEEFLNESVKSLEQVADGLPNLSGKSVEELITDVIMWVSNKTYYQHDLVVLKDYWKLPNETIKEEGGDCEDLAVLGYALLRKAGFRHVFLVSWNTDTSGHVGVVLFVDGEWYLVDPGWAYVNDYGLFMRVNLFRDRDNLFTATIHPSSIHPLIKNSLINKGLARYEWYDYLSNTFTDKPALGRQILLRDLIVNWPVRDGYEAKVWTLITDEKTLITSNVDEVINLLYEVTR
ncbi:MAG: transglutaminase-like domain-containing protein [Sulfolobales archaeon]